MKPEEFRQAFSTARLAADREANESKDSMLALVRLSALYGSFDADERILANDIISEWVLSADETMRYDALALIDEFKIVTAIPALRALSRRLLSSAAPGASYEKQKADRIIASLAVDHDPAAR